jgi:hypothetical protein
MPLDPQKLKTYMAAQEPRPGRPGIKSEAKPVASAVKPFLKPGQNPAALRDLLERGDEVDDAALGRLLSPKVGYMELSEDVKGYACGNCGYAGEGAMCRNPAVLAPVSANRGCCNLFWNEEQVVFPPAAKE